jgi:hypothetical protein
MTITNYDGIIAARAGGKAEDLMALITATVGGVSGAWYSDARKAGLPGSLSPAAIPGGTVLNDLSTGALRLTKPTSPDHKYLLTLGVTVGNANLSAILLADVLVGASGISANTASAQTVNTSALSRYTTGKGVMMVMVVTTALGSTASNVTINYDAPEGTSHSTGAIAMTASCAADRCQPVSGVGVFIPLQAGDSGVLKVNTVTFSAAMGAGVLDIYLFKPLLIIPTIGASLYVERDSTIQIDGLTELVTESGGECGCLKNFVLTSGTTASTFQEFLRTCAG